MNIRSMMINLREEDKRVTPSEVPRVLVSTLPESRPIECQTCRQGHRFCEKPGGTVRRSGVPPVRVWMPVPMIPSSRYVMLHSHDTALKLKVYN